MFVVLSNMVIWFCPEKMESKLELDTTVLTDIKLGMCHTQWVLLGKKLEFMHINYVFSWGHLVPG